MGNFLSTLNDCCDSFYEKYYPKQKWLAPAYVSSAVMVGHVALQLYFSDAKCVIVPSDWNDFIFLFSVAANLGMQTWVGLVNGTTMRAILPRHQFGAVQARLFPKYYFLATFFSFESLAVYLSQKPFQTWQDKSLLMGALLGGSFLLNIFNFTCFNINTIKYNLKMHQIEKDAGEGLTTVGQLMQENKVNQNPEYQKAKSKFWRFHSAAFFSSALTLASSVAQVYLLSSKKLF